MSPYSDQPLGVAAPAPSASKPPLVSVLAACAGPAEQRVEAVGAEPGGDVPGGALAEAVPGDGGQTGGEAVGVGQDGLGTARHHELRPHVGGQLGPVRAGDAHPFAGQQRGELLDGEAEDVPQRARVGALVDGVVLVDDAGEVRDDERAAVLDVRLQVAPGRLRHEVQGRYDDKGIPRHIGFRVGEVDGEVAVVEGLVEGVGALAGLVVDAGAPVEVLRPPGVPVPQHGHVGLGAGAADLTQRLDRGAEFDDLAPHAGVGAAVRDHRRVELLGAAPGLAPLEEQGALGSARHMGEGVAGHLAGGLGGVAELPVDARGGVLQQQPGGAARDGPGEVGGHRQIDVGAAAVGDQVVVVGDEVDLAAPGPVVDGVALAQRRHEVGGDGDARREAVQDVPLHAEVLAHGGVGEPLVVQRLGGVDGRRGEPGRVDVLEVAVALAPEGRAPGLVDRVDRAVRGGEPAAEVGGAGRAVAGGDGDAVLVVDVPHRQRRVVAVALGELPRDGGRGPTVVVVAVADGRPGAELVAHALGGHRQRFGVGPVEPDGRYDGGGAEVDADAVLVQQVQEPVQPAEVVRTG